MMKKPAHRQTGRSLKQIINAEEGAFFVCPSANTKYYEGLATYAGRNDITFVCLSSVKRDAYRGNCRILVLRP